MEYPFIRPVAAIRPDWLDGGDPLHLGSCIVMSARVVVTCFHVVAQAMKSPEMIDTKLLESKLPSQVSILDGAGEPVSPIEMRLDRKKDIAVLVFERDLGVPPATIAIGFNSPTVPNGFEAVGYSVEYRGRQAEITAFPSQPFKIQPTVARGERLPMRFQISGGVSSGNSGGAVLVNDGASRPVLGMIRKGGGDTECYTTNALLMFLIEHGQWPDSVVFWDEREAPADAGVPIARRGWVADLLGFDGPLLELDGEDFPSGLIFSVLPPGRIAGPNGEALIIERPVAIMTVPLDRGMVAAFRDETMLQDGAMALDLTWAEVESLEEQFSSLYGQKFRTPTLAEWWMGMTAGRGGAATSTTVRPYFGRPVSIVENAPNAWGISPTPSTAREWVRPEAGARAASFGPDGRSLPLDPGQKMNNLGIRFVVDLLPL